MWACASGPLELELQIAWSWLFVSYQMWVLGAKRWSSAGAVYVLKCWLSAQPIYSGARYKEFFFLLKFSLVHFPMLCQISRASSQNKAIYLTVKEQVIYFLGL